MRHLPEARKLLEEVGKIDYREYNYRDLTKIIDQYDVLVPSLNVMLDKRLLRKALKLKLIATPSTGIDHIDLETVKDLNIHVISLRGEYDFLKTITATAEYTFGLLLSLVRNITFAFDSVKEGNWRRAQFRGYELRNKILGVIGYGRLGEMVSRYAQAFGMKVIACDPYKKIKDSWVEQMDLDKLLKRADIIAIHVSLNDETKGLLSQREFSLMKKGIFIINTSRGAVIDEKELFKALQEEKVKGAALDVLAKELKGKIKDNPLVKYARTHKNLIITPHIGGATYESQKKAYTFIAKKIKKNIKEGK